MKNLRPRLSFLMILAIPLVTLSCDSVTSPNKGLNVIASTSRQAFGSITFRIGVENAGLTTETLNFGDSQFFDIEVNDLSGRLVWRWSYDKAFCQVLWGLELSPSESSVQETVWNLAGSDQKPVPPGSYTAKIYITSNPRDERLTSIVRLII